ncbi:MAG: hypothetical protein C0483_24390 [Pirellula sp.]|nr:hypothetical protein [Pirellula sp.]
MSFGENSELIDEVIAFAKGDGLLGSSEPKATSWEVVHNLDDAKRIAWETPIGDEELLWTDLREQQMAQVRSGTYGNARLSGIEDVLSEQLSTLTTLMERRLDDQHEELVNDVVGDLLNCAFNRAVNGTNGFYEQLFDAYRAGGWPCGWDGNFPSGRLIVYFRQ